MQVSPISPVFQAGTDRQGAIQSAQKAAEQAKKAEEPVQKEYTPAPPIRPTIQDYVSIDHTLMLLRQM